MPSITKLCSLSDCHKPKVSKGYCSTHYKRFIRTGRPTADRPLRSLHGYSVKKSRHDLYETWVGMKKRCYTSTCAAFKYYGGRGIKVCDRWRYSFPNFLEDMGERPDKKHSIDRIDVNGNYEPGNCRWATMKQQRANQGSRVVNSSGFIGVKKVSANRWIARIGIDYKIINLGCFESPEEAYETYAIRREALSD